jgi:hypothetical protein
VVVKEEELACGVWGEGFMDKDEGDGFRGIGVIGEELEAVVGGWGSLRGLRGVDRRGGRL